MSENCYVCHSCGGTKFCHDVSEVYEEVFDSKEKSVTEGKHYSDGEDWVCKSCGAKIPKGSVSNFLEQMYDATS